MHLKVSSAKRRQFCRPQCVESIFLYSQLTATGHAFMFVFWLLPWKRSYFSYWVFEGSLLSSLPFCGSIMDTISYPLFADADTGIYLHAASQYHARPKAKRGIAMLSVDKFPYPRKQTRGNVFILCSNNICDILKRLHSFKITAITLIWPESPYKHSVTSSYRSGKEKGRRWESPLWRHQWRSFVFISHADDVKREIRLHIRSENQHEAWDKFKSSTVVFTEINVCGSKFTHLPSDKSDSLFRAFPGLCAFWDRESSDVSLEHV